MDSTKTIKGRAVRDQEELPWEMIEEILSHVPPTSLVRFRTVCKRWNALFNDKRFINNHKSTFQFILATKSKIYSVSIDPKIVVRELTLNVPGIESDIRHLVDCNELLLCDKNKEATVWNPWFKQSRHIKADASQPSFGISGIGYVNNNNMRVAERRYKTIGSYWTRHSVWKTQDFSSDVWKDVKLKPRQGENSRKDKPATFFTRYGVSLHGNSYWIAFYDKTDLLYHLLNFNFSSERFYGFFCDLPCGTNHPCDALVLRVFRGDQFSLLKQCYMTKKIEIWVTKNKINVEDGNDVVWMNFMTLSIPNFPGLVPSKYLYSQPQPSYFIDNKRLVLCSCDEAGHPWIYVVEENKLITKVQLNDVVDPWPLHCTYFPSLVPVPGGPREEVLLQV